MEGNRVFCRHCAVTLFSPFDATDQVTTLTSLLGFSIRPSDVDNSCGGIPMRAQNWFPNSKLHNVIWSSSYALAAAP